MLGRNSVINIRGNKVLNVVVSGEQKLGMQKAAWCYLSALEKVGVTNLNMAKNSGHFSLRGEDLCPLILSLGGLSVF